MIVSSESLALHRRFTLLIFAILVVSLWATFMDVLPASVLFVVLAPLVPLLFSQNRHIPRVLVALLALYFYFLASTIFYAPSSLFNPDFYRRDGNFFVTYLPIIIGGLWRIRLDIERLIRGFLKWATAVNGVLICVYLATGRTIPTVESGGMFHSLFVAHNAAGGYLATVSAFAIGLYAGGRRTPVTFLYMAVNILGCALTRSRGSEFGILIAVGVVLLLRERYTVWVLILAAILQISVCAFTYPLWVNMGKPNQLWTYSGALPDVHHLHGREATVADRLLFLWPRATYLFEKSPIFGTGYGSYNDTPYHLVGIPHVLMYNRPKKFIFSDESAHNSYLHILAETGLVGLVLLILVLRNMWVSSDSFGPKTVTLGFRLALWSGIFASFTEHRIVTPSQMLPITLLFGLALAASRATDAPQEQRLDDFSGFPSLSPGPTPIESFSADDS